MSRTLAFHALVLLGMFLCASCCPQNPPQNTALAAHGNTDWHIDTANEFLFGTDMAGSATAANHCPNTWTRRHIHVGLTHTNHFYYDKDLTTPGDDADANDGIDRPMLFFYAGHGSPTGWNTLGNNATQQHMRLGDCPGGGRLRYYWQCSCKVFAHGPKNCPGETFDYSWPDKFDGSTDSASMRNVYERWGPVLDPDLRMAAGASTSAYCHETQMNRIWDRYNNLSYDVADSFISGLNMWGVVPLCITLGGSDVTKTPLYDATFTHHVNTSGTSYYHIQYPSGFASTPRNVKLIAKVPELLPILKIKPRPIPDKLRRVKFVRKGDLLVSPDEVDKRGPRVVVNRLSGAVYVRGRQRPDVKGVLEEKQYLDRARAFVREQGWAEQDVAEPIGVQYVIQSLPVKGAGGKPRRVQKNVTVTFKRQIKVDGATVNVLGEGGVMVVQMNNDGSVLNAAKVWRQIAEAKQKARVKTYRQAYAEALKHLKDPAGYKLDRWAWGYKEAAGNVEQKELKIVFRFAFVPKDEKVKELGKHPPRLVEVPGQVE